MNRLTIDSIYERYDLPNGLRIVHMPTHSPVGYCGFAVNAGARDEQETEHGLAHFVEHMLFKGTEQHKANYILNRMEAVGGELNAYTTKEETFIYSIFMSEHFRRAFDLLFDIVFHSQFPETQIKKEKDVILDEVNVSCSCIRIIEKNPSKIQAHDSCTFYFQLLPEGIGYIERSLELHFKEFTESHRVLVSAHVEN